MPPRSDGDVKDDTDGSQYEDMSIGENAEDDHVSPSSPPTTSGSLPVNRLSRSIEKRWRKQKSVFKSHYKKIRPLPTHICVGKSYLCVNKSLFLHI